MAMLNPKDFDSKGGPSGTVEEVVAVAGDLSGHDLSVKFPKVLLCWGVGGYLPLIGHERGWSHLKVCKFLAFDWRRGSLEEESDD